MYETAPFQNSLHGRRLKTILALSKNLRHEKCKFVISAID